MTRLSSSPFISSDVNTKPRVFSPDIGVNSENKRAVVVEYHVNII